MRRSQRRRASRHLDAAAERRGAPAPHDGRGGRPRADVFSRWEPDRVSFRARRGRHLRHPCLPWWRGQSPGPGRSPWTALLARRSLAGLFDGTGSVRRRQELVSLRQTYLIPSTGGEATRLLPDFASASWPVWSPDSHHLLLTARRNPTDDPEWWVLALDSRAPVKVNGIDVVMGGYRFPVRPWSWTEGNRLVYSTALGGDSWDLWETSIAPGTWTLSTQPTRLTTGANLQAHASIVRGTHVVFASLIQTVNVWSVPLDANAVGSSAPREGSLARPRSSGGQTRRQMAGASSFAPTS